MVFFNCNACGEAVKKNQVEKHYRQQCRSCEVLSCVDCGKEFWGDEYQQHNKCITEDEKFCGQSYKPKANANKGEQKQELWTKQVQDAILKVKANPRLKNLLERLKDYPNIPRKQGKFENFLRNSLRVSDSSLTAQAWNAISAELNAKAAEPEAASKTNVAVDVALKNSEAVCQNDAKSENGKDKKKKDKKKKDTEEESTENSSQACVEVNGNKEGKKKKKNKQKAEVEMKNEEEGAENNSQATIKENGNEEGKKKKNKKNKRKAEDEELATEEVTEQPKKKKLKTEEDQSNEDKLDVSTVESDAVSQEGPSGEFKWEAAIIGVLKRADDKEMSMKKLRKKVLGEYYARGGDGKSYTEERLLAKFAKKINNNPRIKVAKDTVKLVS